MVANAMARGQSFADFLREKPAYKRHLTDRLQRTLLLDPAFQAMVREELDLQRERVRFELEIAAAAVVPEAVRVLREQMASTATTPAAKAAAARTLLRYFGEGQTRITVGKPEAATPAEDEDGELLTLRLAE